MAEIIIFILVILLAIFTYLICRSLFKRLYLVAKLKGLGKMSGAVIKYRTLPILSLIRLSAKPEITVELGDTVYLIRLFGTGSSHRRVHFASPEYTVTIKGKRVQSGALVVGYGNAQFRRSGVIMVNDYSRPKSGKVRVLPPLKVPQKWGFSGKKTVPVLIFNPAPHDVTFVTPDKNKVVAVFTGDAVYDHLIFTASTFAIYADRRYRQEKAEKEKEAYGALYYSSPDS